MFPEDENSSDVDAEEEAVQGEQGTIASQEAQATVETFQRAQETEDTSHKVQASVSCAQGKQGTEEASQEAQVTVETSQRAHETEETSHEVEATDESSQGAQEIDVEMQDDG